MDFGERLATALKGARKTRKDLAAHLGISVQAVGQAIKGKSHALSAENTLRAARYLGCSAWWLATGQPDLTARETGAGYLTWPFQRVDMTRVTQLNATRQELLEALLLRALDELDAP